MKTLKENTKKILDGICTVADFIALCFAIKIGDIYFAIIFSMLLTYSFLTNYKK